MATKFAEFLSKIGYNSLNYEMGSECSLTSLYSRLWSAILCNGPITAIIRVIKLALLECFPGLH